MLRLLLLLPAPALFWAVYHRYKDRHRPEPVRNLLLSYGLGIGAGLLVVRIHQARDLVELRFDAYELAQSNPAGLFLYAVLVIGVAEELVKFVPFWLIGMRLHHFDEPIDGIIYASLVALGFAMYESIHFLQLMKGTEAVMRAIASPLVHAVFASIWGYACSRAQKAGGGAAAGGPGWTRAGRPGARTLRLRRPRSGPLGPHRSTGRHPDPLDLAPPSHSATPGSLAVREWLGRRTLARFLHHAADLRMNSVPVQAGRECWRWNFFCQRLSITSAYFSQVSPR
jgi:hypothetical protein